MRDALQITLLSKAHVISAWGAALVLCTLPFALALDFGGILRWTQYVAALLVMVAGLLALAHSLTRSQQFAASGWQTPIRGHFLAMLLLAWGAFALCQTISIPTGLLAWISSGSYSAYVQWAGPLLAEERFWAPMSIAPVDSWHAIGVLTITALVAWISAVAFNSRGRIALLLMSTSVAGASIGLIGLLRLSGSPFTLWSFSESSNPFSTFVNRNNAACFLNLGLATALALIAWRVSSLSTTQPTNRHRLQKWFTSIFTDWLFVAAVCCGVISFFALVLCGSRGGLLSSLAGGLCVLVACGKQIKSSLLIIAAVGFVSAATLFLFSSNQLPQSISRLRNSIQFKDELANDSRIRHLPDGLSAAMNYLPFGSGLSTYSYAYLPYQSDYPSSWFHHADNLWLEVFVEQGLIGILMSIGILGLLVSAARRLANSPDSADLGLRVAGWYLVGFLPVSQLFDYGLIMPANLFAATALAGLLMSRSQQIAPTQNKHSKDPETLPSMKGKLRFAEKRLAMPVALGVGLLSVSVLATFVLGGEARAESLRHTVDQSKNRFQNDRDRIDESLAMTRTLNNTYPTPDLMTNQADLEFQSARFRETLDSNLPSLIEMEGFFEDASPDSRRLVWRKQLASGARPKTSAIEKDDSAYAAALDTHRRLLRSRPLALEPRIGIVRLEFVHQDLRQSDLAIDQCGKLYRNSFSVISRLANLAARGGDRSNAIELYRRAVELRPRQADQIASSALAAGKILPFEIMPSDPMRRVEASIAILNRSKIDQDTFEWIRAENRIHDFGVPANNAMQQILSGQIKSRVGNTAGAIEHFKQAVRLAPELIEPHLYLIRTYLKVGKKKQAAEQAEEALFYHPENNQLAQLIDSLHNGR